MAASSNVFHNLQLSTENSNTSLSVFARPDTIRRPKTAVFDKFNNYVGQAEDMTEERITGNVKGLRTIGVDEDGKEVIHEEPEEGPPGRIPQMELPEDLVPL